jgi:hypothetical protein
MRLFVIATGLLITALHAGSAVAGVVIVKPVAVPEPTSLALAAIGVGAVAWAKFRRRS